MVCARHGIYAGMAFYLLDEGTPEASMLQGFNTQKVTMMMSQRYASIGVVPKHPVLPYD